MTCDIVFRSKFEKVILNDEQRHIFMSIFEDFLNHTPEEALDILWRLTYDPAEALRIFGKFGITDDFISYSTILSFRNELRYQYSHLYPTFLSQLPNECKTSFISLRDNSDIVVANIVYQKCKFNVGSNDAFSHTLYLLKHSDEKKHFGGIRSLGFNFRETSYLKEFHLRIYDLFKELLINSDYELNSNVYISKSADEEVSTLPVVYDEQEKKTEEKISQKSIEQTGFRSLSVKDILLFENDFRIFIAKHDFTYLYQFSQLGFDLNEILAKEEQIANLFKAIDAFNC